MFFIQAVFEEAKGQTPFLYMWKLFGKVNRMTAGTTFVELEEGRKKGAIENIDSKARCTIVIKLTND